MNESVSEHQSVWRRVLGARSGCRQCITRRRQTDLWNWHIRLVSDNNCSLAAQYLEHCIKSWWSCVVQFFALSIRNTVVQLLETSSRRDRRTINSDQQTPTRKLDIWPPAVAYNIRWLPTRHHLNFSRLCHWAVTTNAICGRKHERLYRNIFHLMLKCSGVNGISNKFCHGQVGQLAENKPSYFIHLHKLPSKQWAEFVESTKSNSRSNLLQTNSHHAQIASSYKMKSYWPICFIFSCFILRVCFWF